MKVREKGGMFKLGCLVSQAAFWGVFLCYNGSFMRLFFYDFIYNK